MTDQAYSEEDLRRAKKLVATFKKLLGLTRDENIEIADTEKIAAEFAKLRRETVSVVASDCSAACSKEVAEERANAKKLAEALREISKGEGEFSRDSLTHAENTIENMKELAQAALAEHERRKR